MTRRLALSRIQSVGSVDSFSSPVSLFQTGGKAPEGSVVPRNKYIGQVYTPHPEEPDCSLSPCLEIKKTSRFLRFQFDYVDSLDVSHHLVDVPLDADSGLISLIDAIDEKVVGDDLKPHVATLAKYLRTSEVGQIAGGCFLGYGRNRHFKVFTLSEIMNAVESELSKIAA